MSQHGEVTGATQVVGVIGDPVSHSRSPTMHNAAFAAAGLDWIYLAWRVRPDRLEAAVRGLRALGVRGFNVTVPHKVAILPFLDELGEEAADIGAVNTVIERDGRWRGENTDAAGFLRSLAAAGVEVRGLWAVLLGAGGAARAVGYALARAGVAGLHIANRTIAKAEALAAELADRGLATVSAGALGGRQLEDALGRAELVVQATSAELSGERLAVPVEWLRRGATFFDLTYGPASARLLAEVRKRGLLALDGEEMLVHQGALAFTAWTGRDAPLEAMRHALQEPPHGRDREESSSGPSK